MPRTPNMLPSGMRRITTAMKLPTAAGPGSSPRTNEPRPRARKFLRSVLRPERKSVFRSEPMVDPSKSGDVALPFRAALSRKAWGATLAAALLAGTAAVYAAPRRNLAGGGQEKEAGRAEASDQATSLTDQTDLSGTG